MSDAPAPSAADAERLVDAAVDSVTIAFGAPDAELYGLARLGLAHDPASGGLRGSALAVLFSGHASVTALVRGSLEPPEDPDWAAIELAGLSTTVEAPLERWTTALVANEGGFDLQLEALGEPVLLDADSPVGRLGGMAGYEQPVRVRGSVRVGGRVTKIDALGQRGRSWGDPDWHRMELARTVCAWTRDGTSVALNAIRPQGARAHGEEAVWSAVWEAGRTLEIDDARISTTYDAEGRTRRAGLELWPSEAADAEGWARRGAGEVLCGTSLDLGALALDVAFFRWHLEGRTGVGRYDVLRPAAADGAPELS